MNTSTHFHSYQQHNNILIQRLLHIQFCFCLCFFPFFLFCFLWKMKLIEFILSKIELTIFPVILNIKTSCTQILTQEDWNVVLFNGMEKTSHWAALYFVALMTFGNYVLFNLLVAILVEGFSSEVSKHRIVYWFYIYCRCSISWFEFVQRNERREREQRELVKKLREENENLSDLMFDDCRSCSESTSTNENYAEVRNKWHSAEDIRNRRVSSVIISHFEAMKNSKLRCFIFHFVIENNMVLLVHR